MAPSVTAVSVPSPELSRLGEKWAVVTDEWRRRRTPNVIWEEWTQSWIQWFLFSCNKMILRPRILCYALLTLGADNYTGMCWVIIFSFFGFRVIRYSWGLFNIISATFVIFLYPSSLAFFLFRITSFGPKCHSHLWPCSSSARGLCQCNSFVIWNKLKRSETIKTGRLYHRHNSSLGNKMDPLVFLLTPLFQNWKDWITQKLY